MIRIHSLLVDKLEHRQKASQYQHKVCCYFVSETIGDEAVIAYVNKTLNTPKNLRHFTRSHWLPLTNRWLGKTVCKLMLTVVN